MAKENAIVTLTPARLRSACRWLAERDSALREVLDAHGYPQLWNRRPGFSTTVHIILEQQVSLASANATFFRLESKLGGTVTVRSQLTQHKGIGNWTADIYLSECLLRCDILPKGDIGVLEAFRVLKGLEVRPANEQLEALTEHWRPWRSVATRMLWLFYLNRR